MEHFLAYLHLVFVGVVALFPPVNPVGTAVIVDPMLRSLTGSARREAARKISLYCLLICFGTAIVGSWLFRLFGISLPIVQLAGGALICRMGWQMLSAGGTQELKETSDPEDNQRVENILFYPLAFPMTTGAGTISVLLTLSAREHNNDYTLYFMNLTALFLSIWIMCVTIYLSYAYTPSLLRRLGTRGEQIVNHLSAFLVFCVGLQIASEGLQHVLHR